MTPVEGMKMITVRNDTSNTSKYKTLLALIPFGAEHGISMKRLSYLLGVDSRNVRKLIEGARLEGNIIASGDSGYYIPETVEELRCYVRIVRARSQTSRATLRAAEKLLSEVSKQ